MLDAMLTPCRYTSTDWSPAVDQSDFYNPFTDIPPSTAMFCPVM
jgi:hypothetical protein